MEDFKVEAEGGELVLRNSDGGYAIIPVKDRKKVEKLLTDGCHDCISEYVNDLPHMSEYAEDGTTVSEIWKQKTGLPWSEAKKRGLTDGSYSGNMDLRNLLMDENFSLNTINEQTASQLPYQMDLEDYSRWTTINGDGVESLKDYYTYKGVEYDEVDGRIIPKGTSEQDIPNLPNYNLNNGVGNEAQKQVYDQAGVSYSDNPQEGFEGHIVVNKKEDINYDKMSFSEAFRTARREQGDNGIFTWRGKKYGTKLANTKTTDSSSTSNNNFNFNKPDYIRGQGDSNEVLLNNILTRRSSASLVKTQPLDRTTKELTKPSDLFKI